MITAACPACGGRLETVEATVFDAYHPGYHVRGTALPTRERRTSVAACTACEFAIDLFRSDGVPKSSFVLLREVGQFLRRLA